jgi:chromosome segregation ATPase
MTEAAEKTRLEADITAATEEIARVREENGILAEDFRLDPSENKREGLRRAAEKLSQGRDRLEAAKAALKIFEKTGGKHGLIAENGRVTGSIAVAAKVGWTTQQREAAIEAALDAPLSAAAAELGVVLAAAPAKYTKERPGRDADGRMILDVAGRVEGDWLTPAVSRAAKQLKHKKA